MNSSRNLGLVLIAPAIVLVVLFFLMPVVLTAVFSFTTMSTATGITGGAYQIAPNAIQGCATSRHARTGREAGRTEIRDRRARDSPLSRRKGIDAGHRRGASQQSPGRGVPVAPRCRAHDPQASTSVPRHAEVKQISEQFNRSLVNARFASEAALFAAARQPRHAQLTEDEKAALAAASYSGWTWTTENFRRMVSSPDTARDRCSTRCSTSRWCWSSSTPTYAMMLALADPLHARARRPASSARCGSCRASRRPSSTC